MTLVWAVSGVEEEQEDYCEEVKTFETPLLRWLV